jgi:hypothetical protein
MIGSDPTKPSHGQNCMIAGDKKDRLKFTVALDTPPQFSGTRSSSGNLAKDAASR